MATGAEPDMVSISADEHQRLVEADMKLSCLEGAGVDNWDGFDAAMEMFEEMKEQQ